MNLDNHARTGARQRARLTAAGLAAGTAALAVLLSPAAQASPSPATRAPVTSVRCSPTDLAAAISGAQSGAVLALAPRCRYVLSSGLTAAVSLTIRGNGDTITAEAPGLTILTVDSGVTVSLDRLTLNNGAPAIYTTGTLNVTDSTFTRNTVAISNSGDIDLSTATLTVTDSAFTGNTGAIDSEARVTGLGGSYEAIITVTDSTFSGNSSSGAGGAISAGDSLGTLKGDRFTGNTAASGGAVATSPCRNEGNDLVCGTLAITGSTFTRNAATDPANGYGGGLYNAGTVTLTDTVMTGNMASVDGGGIYNHGALALTRTQVRSNTPDNCAPAGTIAGCTG
jgi:predicted outer membrane repeat protein